MADVQSHGIPPISVVLDEELHLYARAKSFKTGSQGWYANSKGLLQGEKVQISLCITIIGSKGQGVPAAGEGVKRPTLASNAGVPSEAAPLSDGSEAIEVVGEPPVEPYANRKASWRKK